jgi:hypothetical protein
MAETADRLADPTADYENSSERTILVSRTERIGRSLAVLETEGFHEPNDRCVAVEGGYRIRAPAVLTISLFALQ